MYSGSSSCLQAQATGLPALLHPTGAEAMALNAATYYYYNSTHCLTVSLPPDMRRGWLYCADFIRTHCLHTRTFDPYNFTRREFFPSFSIFLPSIPSTCSPVHLTGVKTHNMWDLKFGAAECTLLSVSVGYVIENMCSRIRPLQEARMFQCGGLHLSEGLNDRSVQDSPATEWRSPHWRLAERVMPRQMGVMGRVYARIR